MSFCETSDNVNCEDWYVCGEILSPTTLEKGRIYVGDYPCHLDSQSRRARSYNCTYTGFELFNNCSDDEEEDYTQEQSEIEDESITSETYPLQKQLSCPYCSGTLRASYDYTSSQLPPFCPKCNSFFLTVLQSKSEKILHNLVDALLQNDSKGTIVLLENEIELNSKTTTQIKKIDKKKLPEKSIIETFSDEEEDSSFGIERITTDKEEKKIIQNLKKT